MGEWELSGRGCLILVKLTLETGSTCDETQAARLAVKGLNYPEHANEAHERVLRTYLC